IERKIIYRPDTAWFYNHHASITHFKDKLVAVWSDGMKDEDQPRQRILFATSKDFYHWTTPEPLAVPSVYSGGTHNILTAAGFNQFNDTLVAYYGEYSPQNTHTHLWAKISTDGKHWSDAIDMHVPVNPNHGPEKIKSGRLIISGNFTFSYTDDYRGLSGWKMSSFYQDSLYKEDNPATFYAPAEKSNLPPLCEGSFFQTDDGTIHMLLRVTGKGWKGKLWLTESKDNGEHWSFPIETNFTDNDSKFHFGRLPDKRFYFVGIPDTLHHYDRTPLVLSLSSNGKLFGKNYIIADQPYTLKKAGLYKGGQYGYPHTMVYHSYMYVIISRQKEAIEVIRFKLDQLNKLY
ncbi:MAG: exo-alpha-sialidase, partial [Ginsengibacter sp.]